MLIVCPNLAFDHTVRLAELRPGEVIRTGPGRSVAGGKGANVARAARALGGRPRVAGFVALDGGDRLVEMFGEVCEELLAIEVPGVVRTCTAMLEDGGRVTLLNEPGPEVAPADWLRLQEAALSALGADELLALSGSLPPGSPPDSFAELVSRARAIGHEVAVDTSGPALALALDAGPDLVCPNLSEAESLLTGRTGESVDESGPEVPGRARRAALALAARGAGVAVVTAGASGVAVAQGATCDWLPAMRVEAKNPIGAGDSFLAGVLCAREAGRPWLQAVRHGVATAAASVEQPGAAVVDPQRVAELERQYG